MFQVKAINSKFYICGFLVIIIAVWFYDPIVVENVLIFPKNFIVSYIFLSSQNI